MSAVSVSHLVADGTVVIVGGHQQLPPIVLCEAAKMMNLGVSIFERLIGLLDMDPIMLRLQYRMVPSICRVAAELFYYSTAASWRLPSLSEICRIPLVFHGHTLLVLLR